MRVIAVIPSWNAAERIGDCLGSLVSQVDHVVLVDNASADGTVETAGGFDSFVSTVVNDDNYGYATAVNQGVREALERGAHAVLLVNDDAIFGPTAVGALAGALDGDPVAGAASAHMVYADQPRTLNGAGGEFDPNKGWAALRGAGEPDRGQYETTTLVDYPSGAASLIRRQAFEDVGLLDEAFFLYFEDADWGLRARLEGWTTVYVPSARVSHVGSAGTAEDPARRRYYNVRNRLLLAQRHASARGRSYTRLAILALLAKQPVRWLWPQRRRDAEAAMWGVADYCRGRFGRSDRFR